MYRVMMLQEIESVGLKIMFWDGSKVGMFSFLKRTY